MSTSDSNRIWKAWLERLHHEEASYRHEAAEEPPADADAKEIVAALAPLLHDEDSLVRLCAAESLGLYPGPPAAVALREFVRRESDPLSMAYGLSSLGLVGDESDIPMFQSIAQSQCPDSVMIHGVVGFFELVRRVAISRLTAYLRSDSEVRTSAAEGLGIIMKTPQRSEVIAALRDRLSKETERGPRSYIEGALQSLSAKD